MTENLSPIGVIDYGAGNIGNVLRALRKLGLAHAVLRHPSEVDAVCPSLLLLPGVGAFRPAMDRLVETGWGDFLKKWAATRRPLLGICLGMQLLCTQSTEDGRTDGLGLLDGNVERFSGISKIPHMGWNTAEWHNPPASWHVEEEDAFYFVHGYAVMHSSDCAAQTYIQNVAFCSALHRENVAGFQFHPERSGDEGIAFWGRVIRDLVDVYA